MSFNYAKSGPNNAPQYQMSGVPFVTASVANEVPGVHDGSGAASVSAKSQPININFDYVTKWIEIKNTHAPKGLRVALTMSGAFELGERLPEHLVKGAGKTRNFFVVEAGKTVKYDFRCKSLFFVANTVTGDPEDTSTSTSQFQLSAGLTNIPATNFPILTGSITGSATPLFPDGIIDAFDGVG